MTSVFRSLLGIDTAGQLKSMFCEQIKELPEQSLVELLRHLSNRGPVSHSAKLNLKDVKNLTDGKFSELVGFTVGVRKIDLTNCNIGDKEFNSGITVLKSHSPDFASLKLNNSFVSPDSLKLFLKEFPSLRSLSYIPASDVAEPTISAQEVTEALISWSSNNPFLKKLTCGVKLNGSQFVELTKSMKGCLHTFAIQLSDQVSDEEFLQGLANLSELSKDSLRHLKISLPKQAVDSPIVHSDFWKKLPKLFPNLESFDVGQNREFVSRGNDDIYKAFKDLKHLKHLVVRNLFSSDQVLKLINKLEGLKSLDLSGSEYLTFEEIKSIAEALAKQSQQSFTSINLRECPLSKEGMDMGIKAFVSNLPSLRHLVFDEHKATLETIHYLVENAGGLLNAAAITDGHKNFSALQTISFLNVRCSLTSSEWLELASNLRNLRVLIIEENNIGVFKSALFKIIQNNPQLELIIPKKSGLTKEILEEIAQFDDRVNKLVQV